MKFARSISEFVEAAVARPMFWEAVGEPQAWPPAA